MLSFFIMCTSYYIFEINSDSQLALTMSWDERLSELMEFKQEWGHCDILQKYAKTSKLGKWVNNQRQQYRLLKSGKKSLINNERIVELDNVGFQWISDSWLIHSLE